MDDSAVTNIWEVRFWNDVDNTPDVVCPVQLAGTRNHKIILSRVGYLFVRLPSRFLEPFEPTSVLLRKVCQY